MAQSSKSLFLFLLFATEFSRTNPFDSPVEAGKQGGSTTGTGSSGSDDSGSGNKKAFAGGKVDPVEAGKSKFGPLICCLEEANGFCRGGKIILDGFSCV